MKPTGKLALIDATCGDPAALSMSFRMVLHIRDPGAMVASDGSARNALIKRPDRPQAYCMVHA